MSILTQRLLEVKALHETGRVTFAQAVAAVFEDADPDSIKRQIAAIGKPRTSKPTRQPRTSKAAQTRKQYAAMAELVGRVNDSDAIPFRGEPVYSREITSRDEVL